MTRPDTNSLYRKIEQIEKDVFLVRFDIGGGFAIIKHDDFIRNRIGRRRTWSSAINARDAYLKERLYA